MTLDEFVAACRDVLVGPEQLDVITGAVTELVDQLSQQSAPERTVYNTLLRSPSLTIQHITLPPSAGAPPHDHRMPAVIGIYAGEERNVFFDRAPDDTISPTRERTLRAGDVEVMPADTVHAIMNETAAYTGAVHVYLGDLFSTRRSRWTSAHPEDLDESLQERLAAAAQAEEARLARPLRATDVQRLLAKALSASAEGSSR